jgi:hypothetical protein
VESECRKRSQHGKEKEVNHDSVAGGGGTGKGRASSSGRSRRCFTVHEAHRAPRGVTMAARGHPRARQPPRKYESNQGGDVGERGAKSCPRLIECGLRFHLRPEGRSLQRSSHVGISDRQGPALATDCDQRKPAQPRGCPSPPGADGPPLRKQRRGNFSFPCRWFNCWWWRGPRGRRRRGAGGECAAGVRVSVCGYAAAYRWRVCGGCAWKSAWLAATIRFFFWLFVDFVDAC